MINHYYQQILLIDDNDVDNYLSQHVINRCYFAEKTNICTTGLEALNYIKNRLHDISLLPDVIFLDLNMPVVDGFIFLFEWEDFPQEVKEKCKIVVLSSMLDTEIIDKVSKNHYVS